MTSLVDKVAIAMIAAMDRKQAFIQHTSNLKSVSIDGHVDMKALARAAILAVRSDLDAGTMRDGDIIPYLDRWLDGA
ncbi:hypothetical protein [Phyllobacterium lublinensis]|uniref:hypothetical protein n=1 Tax=Phyllobacterium lublinensis TaxID=2875708 RepID=UPI001CCF4937|nr:hypothetical protein [Phyllobacterium sp. 2063]MBZ9656596.1 hypothetical protein [Phyllobacterium sp. 2063]